GYGSGQVFKIFTNCRDLRFRCRSRSVGGHDAIEVERFDLAQRLDRVLRGSIGEIAESDPLRRADIDDVEYTLLRNAHHDHAGAMARTDIDQFDRLIAEGDDVRVVAESLVGRNDIGMWPRLLGCQRVLNDLCALILEYFRARNVIPMVVTVDYEFYRLVGDLPDLPHHVLGSHRIDRVSDFSFLPPCACSLGRPFFAASKCIFPPNALLSPPPRPHYLQCPNDPHRRPHPPIAT